MKSVCAYAVTAFLALMFTNMAAAEDRGYIQNNLVANESGLGTGHLDPHLINGWGLAYLPGSPFWVSDQGTGASTLYTDQGATVPLVVTIPMAPAPSIPLGFTVGSPTGLVANPTSDFVISKNGKSGPALFIFATLDGTISGWNPNVDLNNAVIMVDNSTEAPIPALYTGLAIGKNRAGHNVLYAADAGFAVGFSNNRIDMFDGNWNSIGNFTDSTSFIPPNELIYGVQNVNGQLYVTFSGLTVGDGAVDVFNTNGEFVSNFTRLGPLDSPWGVVQAPADFGKFSCALLIGNVDDGKINAFDPDSHRFLGQLQDTNGEPIAILGLWSLVFGDGNQVDGQTNQLFFSAGPGHNLATIYTEGLFGMIQAAHGDQREWGDGEQCHGKE